MNDDPAPYVVHLTDGPSKAYDRINILENGWLSGWIDAPSRTVNEKIPPNQIEIVTTAFADPTGPIDEDHDPGVFRRYTEAEAADD